jgi:hypothetical protein
MGEDWRWGSGAVGRMYEEQSRNARRRLAAGGSRLRRPNQSTRASDTKKEVISISGRRGLTKMLKVIT